MNEILLIENYLSGNLSGSEQTLMEARLLIDKSLADNLHFQKQTYGLVKLYGQKILKQEIDLVHKKMFTDARYKNFRETIYKLFKRNI